MSSDQGHDLRLPDLAHLPSDPALRVKAMESLLVEKGLVDPRTIDAYIEKFENEIGPHNGARVVARAWLDADFKQRLLRNATEVVNERGFIGDQTTDIVAVENTPTVHNLVVCTLCSCYPWALLGLPPPWYKSFAYRSRAVREPRAVLNEFGVELRRRCRGPRMGLDRGDQIFGRAGASGGDRAHERRNARRDRHPGFHDRRGKGPRLSHGRRTRHGGHARLWVHPVRDG